MQFPIWVKDWQKYDTLTFVGSIGRAALNSVRVTIGGKGVPFDITYTSSNPTSVSGDSYSLVNWRTSIYDEEYLIDEITTGSIDEYYEEHMIYAGKTLYCITVDLSGVDRTLTQDLSCYFTCVVNGDYGFSTQVVGVTGSVNTADTTNVTWWHRFTTFLTNLFSPSDPDAEDFGSSMESEADDLQDAVDEMGQVTKPDVEDLDISLDDYLVTDGMEPVNGVLTAIFSNQIVVTMLVICLTCAFASYALFGKR